MAGIAARGKTSTGWFYGFKLHLVINDQGELLDVCFTPGNVDDRKPVPKLTEQLITRIKSNMKNHLIPLFDKLLLRKRAVVETVIDPTPIVASCRR
jgi:hypothetical protein